MRRSVLAVATVLALLACASSAYASGRAVIDDCTADEVLSKIYTQKDYHDALAELPADADQYGNCRDIIERAQEAAAANSASKPGAKHASGAATTGGGGSGGTGTGSAAAAPPASPETSADPLATASPADRAAIAAAATNGRTAGDDLVKAADVGRAPGTDQVADLPTPIVVLLALLCMGALAFAVVRIRGLVHTRRA